MAQAHPATPNDAPAPHKGLHRIAAALHHRDFRVLWFGACFSSIGTWMQSLAENWLVLSLTASAFYLGLDAFLQQLPIMLFTLIGRIHRIIQYRGYASVDDAQKHRAAVQADAAWQAFTADTQSWVAGSLTHVLKPAPWPRMRTLWGKGR